MDFLENAFRSLRSLDEEVFDLSIDGSNDELKDFLDTDEQIDTVTIIDDEAEDEEDLQDSYMGKVILDCNVCHSLIYKNPDEVVLDGDEANMEEECPYCYSLSGYKVVGQVKPFSQVEDELEDDEEVSDDEIDEIGDGVDADDEVETSDDLEFEEDKDDDLDESLNESSIFDDVDESVLEDDDNLEECGDDPLMHEAGDTVGDGLVDESLQEDLKNVDVTTDSEHLHMDSDESGRVTITSEPIEPAMDDIPMDDGMGIEEPVDGGGEVIGEVDADVQDDIMNSEDEESEEDIDNILNDESEEDNDFDVDEFDETTFESLGESYLKNVYGNVKSFKVSNVQESHNRLCIEGIINFNSGNSKKTNFIFRNKGVSKSGSTIFEGYNKEITRSNKSFSLSGRIEGGKIISESLSYKYSSNKNRVSGKVDYKG